MSLDNFRVASTKFGEHNYIVVSSILYHFCISVTGVPQGSILGPLFFLIYINDLSDGLTSNPKLFANDTSLFSVAQNINSTANDLNSDLMEISDWAIQWKMRFNPDPKKQLKRWFSVEKLTKLIILRYILIKT